ncbi:hypothetical protein EVAR_73919_1, partial [Eumeta japonica]
ANFADDSIRKILTTFSDNDGNHDDQSGDDRMDHSAMELDEWH